LVQRLDIAQRVREAQAGHTDLVGREPVKHERVIRIRAVRHGDLTNGSGYGSHKEALNFSNQLCGDALNILNNAVSRRANATCAKFSSSSATQLRRPSQS